MEILIFMNMTRSGAGLVGNEYSWSVGYVGKLAGGCGEAFVTNFCKLLDGNSETKMVLSCT